MRKKRKGLIPFERSLFYALSTIFQAPPGILHRVVIILPKQPFLHYRTCLSREKERAHVAMSPVLLVLKPSVQIDRSVDHTHMEAVSEPLYCGADRAVGRLKARILVREIGHLGQLLIAVCELLKLLLQLRPRVKRVKYPIPFNVLQLHLSYHPFEFILYYRMCLCREKKVEEMLFVFWTSIKVFTERSYINLCRFTRFILIAL